MKCPCVLNSYTSKKVLFFDNQETGHEVPLETLLVTMFLNGSQRINMSLGQKDWKEGARLSK